MAVTLDCRMDNVEEAFNYGKMEGKSMENSEIKLKYVTVKESVQSEYS